MTKIESPFKNEKLINLFDTSQINIIRYLVKLF